jgi:hypothetical protein
MTLDLFEEIKARLSIAEVVAAYGVHINRHNKAVCPFHKEDTASFTIYPATNTWYCFGCNVGGSVIDFAAKYYGMEPLAAAKQFDNDFLLGLAGQELTPAEQQRAAEKARERKENQSAVSAFNTWEDDYFIFLCDSIYEFERTIETAKPFSDPWVFAHNRKLILEYHQDIIMDGSADDKVDLFNYVMGGARH